MIETRRRVRTLCLTAAILLTAVIADTLLWYTACRRLETELHDAAITSGWTLSTSATRWSGWPIAAKIVLPDATLRAGPDILPPLTWTAPRVDLRLSAFHPTVVTASASGAQTLAVGAAPPVPFTAQTLTATIDLTAHDPVHVAASAIDVAAPNGPVRVTSANLLLLPDGLFLDLAGVTLPGRAGLPITPSIETLRFDGHIAPPIEPQPTATDSARLWRSRGGKLDLDGVSLRWGPLAATGHATLTLDQALQPAITAEVSATGLPAVIEQLAQTGSLTRSAATAAQGMLVILSAPTGGGAVTLPVVLRDGVVSVARIPLLRLAPLQWDGP